MWNGDPETDTEGAMNENCRASGREGRRKFLRTLACGAAAGLAAAPALLASEEKKKSGDRAWVMRLSTSSIHYSSLPIEEACEKIARLNFDAVDIWSAHAGCPHLDDAEKRLGPGGLKEMLEKHKLKLFSFSVYQGGYPRYADLLGKAGGGVAVRSSAGPCKPAEVGARMREFLESLKPEVELAEKNNSYLAVENHGNALLDSIDSFKAFTDGNRSPRLGIALAPYHLQAIGASVEDAIAVSGKQLFFFYAWQKAEGLAQLPGHGPTDFTPWILALSKADYRGCVNPFQHGEIQPDEMSAALLKSRDYLKERCAKALAGLDAKPGSR